MSRDRLPSRPDPRLDPDSTPPGGTHVEPGAPWYARVIVKLADTIRDEMRDLRARVGSIEDGRDHRLNTLEERVDKHEDRLEDTKTRFIKSDVIAERRKPWSALLFVILGGVTVGLLMLGAGVAIGRCTSSNIPKVEVKP